MARTEYHTKCPGLGRSAAVPECWSPERLHVDAGEAQGRGRPEGAVPQMRPALHKGEGAGAPLRREVYVVGIRAQEHVRTCTCASSASTCAQETYASTVPL